MKYIFYSLLLPDFNITYLSSSDVFLKLKIGKPEKAYTSNEKSILRIVAVLYESKSGSRHTYPTPNPDITTNVVNINLQKHSYIYYFWAY
jgi:hypothetical protein